MGSDLSLENSYLIGLAEFKQQMKALSQRPLIARHIDGKWYINGFPNDQIKPDDNTKDDLQDWPAIVCGIATVTGWTYNKMEEQMGLGHGTICGYAKGRNRPRRLSIKERLIAMAHTCGVPIRCPALPDNSL